jgi:NodT family efflux transporter outer membrane factor (OMF) lipoprotein
MKAASIALLAAGLALAACSVTAPPRPASTLVLPSAWRTTVGPGAQPEAAWWSAFGDPVLNALVLRALAHNGDLRIAAARLREYQARVTIAASAQQPGVTANFTPVRARAISAFGTPIEATSINGNVQASYELDLFGKLASTTTAARAELQSQLALADATALSVAASTAAGYLLLRGLDAQLVLAHETLLSRERSLALAKRQFDVGYSSRLDWAQAQSEYHVTAAVVPQLERAIAQQENALGVLAGESPGPIARGAPLDALAVPAIAPGLPSELLRRRPDIAQAERAIEAADASLAAARDQLLPSLRLNASAGLQAYSVSQLLRSPNLLWSVGGSVLAPLFDAGRLRAQADIAASQRDRAIFAYETVVRNAFAETDNALAGVQRLTEQLAQAVLRRQAAAEVLRVAHQRYANGYASHLEELDAQRNAFSAELGVLQLRSSLLAAHVDLYRALGGAWQPSVRATAVLPQGRE